MEKVMQDSNFQKHIKQLYGKAGERWIKELPGIVERYENKWSLNASEPFQLSYNFVVPVTLEQNKSAVMKVYCPSNKEFETEIKALEIYGGLGAVKVLRKDVKNKVVLLERAEPGEPLRNVVNEKETRQIACKVIKLLQDANLAENAYSFPTLQTWAKPLGKYLKKYSHLTGPLPKQYLDKAERLSLSLVASSQRTVLLHGDLHNDNIISSRRGWLAIDPKGVIGDPVFEPAVFLRNPYYDLPKGSNYKKIESERIQEFSEQLGFEKERLMAWTFVAAVLSFLWFLEDEGEVSKIYLRNAELLDELRI